MKKILFTLLIALTVIGCATRKPAPISDGKKAQVEEKSIGVDSAGGGAGKAGAGGQGGAGSNVDGSADGTGSDGIRGTTAGAGGAGVDGNSSSGAAGAGGGVTPGANATGNLAQRSIYFDYDSFSVKDEHKPILQAHAKFLVENAGAKIYLQGHTDERGSREYNLALGQKRADAVRRVMAVLGVKENQVESVSYGEEKPKNSGHDEAAYVQNRRADIVYQGE
jgi:peptidoglycan-associated lipoprotein